MKQKSNSVRIEQEGVELNKAKTLYKYVSNINNNNEKSYISMDMGNESDIQINIGSDN